MGWTGAINLKVHATKSRRNLSQRTHPIHPIGRKTHVWLCFVVFGCIWDHTVAAWNSMLNGLNWCNLFKSSCHEVISELFTKNAPDPPHWTLNSCFVAFRSVWVHLGPFRYSMKLGEKRPKLAIDAKVCATKSRRTFRNERTRSNPLDPKLTFWCVSYYFVCIRDRLVALRNSVQNGPN